MTPFRFEGTGLGGAGAAEDFCFAEGFFFECLDLMGEVGCGLSVGWTGAEDLSVGWTEADGAGEEALGVDKLRGARATDSPACAGWMADGKAAV